MEVIYSDKLFSFTPSFSMISDFNKIQDLIKSYYDTSSYVVVIGIVVIALAVFIVLNVVFFDLSKRNKTLSYGLLSIVTIVAILSLFNFNYSNFVDIRSSVKEKYVTLSNSADEVIANNEFQDKIAQQINNRLQSHNLDVSQACDKSENKDKLICGGDKLGAVNVGDFIVETSLFYGGSNSEIKFFYYNDIPPSSADGLGNIYLNVLSEKK